MKVFKINDCDWVCAESKEDAIDFYLNEIGESDIELIECSLDETMLYGLEDEKELKKFLREHGEQIVNVDKICTDFEYYVRLSFQKLIELKKITQPCVIASTEL